MRSLTQPMDGRGLAIARIGVGIAGLLLALEVYLVLLDVSGGDVISAPMWDGLPVVTMGVANGLFGLTSLAAVFLIMGLFTRPAAMALSVGLVATVLAEQQTYSHHLTLCAWCGVWLAMSRSDARWSMTARIDGPRNPVFADQLLLMTQLTVVYGFTGLLKVNERFLSGETIQDNARWDLPDQLAVVMAVAAVCTEIALAIGLWFPRTRWWVAGAGVGLHLSIPLVMPGLGFITFSLLTLSLYPLFLVASVEPKKPSPEAGLHLSQAEAGQ